MSDSLDRRNDTTKPNDGFQRVGVTLAFTFGGSVLVIVINLVFTPILIRLLSQDQYGKYAFLVSLITFSSTLLVFGVNDALKKFAALFGLQPDTKQSFLTAFLGLAIVFGCVSLIIGGTGLYLVNRYQWIPTFSRHLLWFVAGVITLQVIFELVKSCLYGMHLQKISEPLEVLLKIGWKSCALVVVWMGSQLHGLFQVWFFTLLFFVFIGLFLLFRRVSTLRYSSIFTTFRTFVPTLLKHGAWVFASAMFMQILYQADILMIGTMLDAKSTALYKPALVAVHFLWIVPQIANRSFLPSFSEHWERGNRPFIRKVLRKSVKFTCHSLLLLGGGLFVLSRSFTKLYFGNQYLESALLIQILVVGTAAFGLSRLTGSLFQASGHVRAEASCVLVAAGTNVILNYFFIRWYGITGAATATSLTYGLLLITKTWGLRFVTGVNLLHGLPVYRFFLLGTLWLSLLYGYNRLFPYSPLLRLIFVSGFGFVTYLLSSYMFNLLDVEEIKSLKASLNGN